MQKPILVLIALGSYGMFSGCGNSGDLQQAMASIRAAQQASEPVFAGNELELGDSGNDKSTDGTMEFPSPERTDPFVWDARYNENVGSEERTGQRVVRVMGFIETDKPRVMLSVDGQVETLAVGESLQRVEVVEINVPRVKLTSSNITWTASIFDDRSTTSQ